MEGTRSQSNSKSAQKAMDKQSNTHGNKKRSHHFVANTTKAIANAIVPKRTCIQLTAPETVHLPSSDGIIENPSMNVRVDTQPSNPEGTEDTHVEMAINNNSSPDSVETSSAVAAGTEESAVATAKPKKNVRGKSRGVKAEKVFAQLGTKIPVTLKLEDGKPSGKYARMFSSEIGFIARNHIPLNVEKWSKVTPEVKAVLGKRLINRFDIDLALPWVKRYVHHTFGVAFSNFRTQLKKKFQNFPNVEEAKKNKPSEVKTAVEWEYLCNYFSSEEFQKKSEQNTINRSKLKYHHKAGSRSFLLHVESTAPTTGSPIDAIDRFVIQYKSEQKGWDLGAKEKWDEMVLMRSEATNEDGTCSITAEKIVEKVLGTKSGYIKGSGFGPQPTTTRFSKSAMHEVYEKNQELEDTIQAQSQEIKALNERSAKFEEFMAKFKDQMADV